MKTIAHGIILVVLTVAISAIYGEEPPRGVNGVDVILKQDPRTHALTDRRGNFALDALPAGSYTLTFRARKASGITKSVSDKVIVATSYSIKIDGTKRALDKSGLMSDDLLDGVEVDVD